MSARAAAMRSPSGREPLVFFSGLPGVTSHQTRSSLSRFIAEQAGVEMGAVRRIESAAEQADAHAGRVRRNDPLVDWRVFAAVLLHGRV